MTITGVARWCVVAGLALTACTSGGGTPPPSVNTSPSVAGPSVPQRSSAGTSTSPTAAPPSTSTSQAQGTPPAGGAVPPKFVPLSATFVSADDGWVLGTAPCSQRPCTAIVRTRDGGRTWQAIPAPRAGTGDTRALRPGPVTTLRFADQRDGWAGATGLFSTHDGGTTWVRQSISGRVGDIETGGGHVFVTTDSCRPPDQRCTSRVFASPVGHDTWHAVTPRLPTGSGVTSLVVHGAAWFAGSGRGIYHGTGDRYAGRLPDPCPRVDGPYRAPGLAIADERHLDAVCVGEGGMGSAQYRLYGSTDGGRSWHAAGRPFVGASGLNGVADNAHGVLLLAESSGASELQRTTDDGHSFTSAHVRAAPGGIPWTDLGFTTADQAFAVLDAAAMYLSTDAAHSFHRVQF